MGAAPARVSDGFHYRAWGLGWRCDRPLPALAPAATPARDANVAVRTRGPRPERLEAGTRALCHESDPTPGGTLRVWRLRHGEGADWHLHYPDGTEFLVAGDGREVWVGWPARGSLENAGSYLLGPVAGLVLRLHARACLHAAAVEIGGRAVAIAGPPGHAKSTLAAAFACAGHAVLGDDVMAVTAGAAPGGAPRVPPGCPRIALRPAAAAALAPETGPLPRLLAQGGAVEKRVLALDDGRFRYARAPLALAAVYVGVESDGAAPHVDPMTPAAAMMTLLANAYAWYLLDRGQRAEEFDRLGRVAASVPVRRLAVRPDLGRVAEVRGAIVRDVEALPGIRDRVAGGGA